MKTNPIIITSLIVLLNIVATAQIDKMREKLDDAMLELDEGLLTLRFSDAETGDPVEKAIVNISNIGNFISDGLGIINFPIPEKDGSYEVHVRRESYITVSFPIKIVAQTLFYNRFTLSKKMPIGQLRIVLEWDKNPADLDAHFEKENDYHISYRNMKVSNDGIARLDRDDRDGYGPETITVKNIDERNTYRFYIHNYSSAGKSNSDKLSKSKANVKVYGDNKLLEIFQIPLNTDGIYWEVFTITDGQINRVNSIKKTLEL